MDATDELSKSHTLYYEILINGLSLGIFGHDSVRNMHLSIAFSLGTQDVFASAVCEEGGELYFYDWLQHPVEAQDKVEFRRADSRTSQPPRNKYRMKPPDAEQQHPK